MKHWQISNEDGIFWLTLDSPDASTNVLSPEVLDELDDSLDEISAQHPKGLIIRSGKDTGFIAGADINVFSQVQSEQQALDFILKAHGIFNRIEAFKFPTLAMIHGFCLGGGLELALACRYRIALDEPSTRLGLPEVKLGIHPGFGGSVRLLNLISPLAAMDLMLTGRAISASAARKMGIINHALPKRHMERGAREMIMNPPGKKPARWTDQLQRNALIRPLIAQLVQRQVKAKANPHHYPAPYALIELWRKYGGNRKNMLLKEADSVARLIMGDTAQSLVRVFHLQNTLKSQGDKKAFAPRHIHVIGGGVMGGDIAAWCALQGFTVTLQDREAKYISRAMGRAYDLFKKKLKIPRAINPVLDRLIPDVEGRGVEKADVIIEAIFENKEAKQELFRNIEPRMKPDAIMATNTSSIPLEEIASVLKDPGRLVGLHFFNPVAQMPLLEIVRSSLTHDDVMQKATAFSRHIDKLPLAVKSAPGFLVNRVLMPYLLEAVTLLEEGHSKEAIDKAATDFGMPMGPIELADTVGLDVCLHVASILSAALGGEVPALLKSMVEQQKLGRKSGSGFYQYKKGKPVHIKSEAQYDSTIQQRMIYRMLNECAACLREGIVENADLLDAGVIFGTGFAPFLGGPMHYVHKEGEGAIKARFEDLQTRFGKEFTADQYWPEVFKAG